MSQGIDGKVKEKKERKTKVGREQPEEEVGEEGKQAGEGEKEEKKRGREEGRKSLTELSSKSSLYCAPLGRRVPAAPHTVSWNLHPLRKMRTGC